MLKAACVQQWNISSVYLTGQFSKKPFNYFRVAYFGCIDSVIHVSTPPAFQMWFSSTLSYLACYCMVSGLKNHLSINAMCWHMLLISRNVGCSKVSATVVVSCFFFVFITIQLAFSLFDKYHLVMFGD